MKRNFNIIPREIRGKEDYDYYLGNSKEYEIR